MLKTTNNYNVAFLILHYYTIEDTKKCIESIIENCSKNEFKNYEIIIVDNGSKNNTGKKLEEIYQKNEKVNVIINEENLGFSTGNNVGFKFIKEKYDVDFIIMINNDIFMIQDNFLNLLFKEYEESSFDILGPKIVLPKGNNDYHRSKLQPIFRYRIEICKLYIKWLINFIDKKEFLRQIKNRFINKSYVKQENSIKSEDIRQENIVIHGSCIIFSKNYIEKFDGLDEYTFLYGEEDLLYIKIISNNMKSVYNPKLYIFHNEDSSTNAITKNNKRSKILFTAKYGIIARKIIIKKIKENKEILKRKKIIK